MGFAPRSPSRGRFGAFSGPSARVSSSPPSNSVAPAITGYAWSGDTLTVTPGTWTGGGTSTYQWRLCDSGGASCSNISLATGSTYVVQSGDIGSTIRVVETRTNGAGATSSTSSATAVVINPLFLNDTFTGATAALNLHTPETGGAWTIHPSRAGTQALTGTGYCRGSSSVGALAIYYNAATPAVAEYDVDFVFFVHTALTGEFVAARISTSALDFYWVYNERPGGNLKLMKTVAGVDTTLDTTTTSGSVAAAGNITGILRIRDAAKQVIVGGNTILTSTDNTITAAGKVGVGSAVASTYSNTSRIHVDTITATLKHA